MDLVFLLLLPFAGALVAALLPTHARTTAATWAAVVSAAGLGWVLWHTPVLQAGTVLREEYRWIPSAGINLVVRMDGLAWMFALLVTGIGLLVAVYARYYMSQGDPVPRFFAFFLAFMGAMLGVVLAGNLVQLVFFWELTSLLSFLLIGYWHHRKDARRGARMALTVTAGGGLCLLAGVLMLGHIAGSYELDTVLAAGARIQAHPLYTPTLVLVLIGKLASSPWFWLFLVAGVVLLVRAAPGWERWKRPVHTVLAYAPGSRNFYRCHLHIQFLTSLALQLRAGLPLLGSLREALDSSGSPLLDDSRAQVLTAVMDGMPLSQALLKEPLLGESLSRFLEAGEETGRLDAVLEWMARMTADKLEYLQDGLMSLLEPFILLVMGIVAGVVTVGTLLPTFQILDQL